MEITQKDFTKAYDENADALFRHCFFKVHDREMAKDMVQETFVKTWGYLVQGKKILNLRAFLYKTLNNLIIDEYRKKKTVSLDDLREDGFEPESEIGPTADDRFMGEKAMKLLDKLPAPYKDAVFMRFVNGLELSEIAEITGETENTVSVHVHRGLGKLRDLFKND